MRETVRNHVRKGAGLAVAMTVAAGVLLPGTAPAHAAERNQPLYPVVGEGTSFLDHAALRPGRSARGPP